MREVEQCSCLREVVLFGNQFHASETEFGGFQGIMAPTDFYDQCGFRCRYRYEFMVLERWEGAQFAKTQYGDRGDMQSHTTIDRPGESQPTTELPAQKRARETEAAGSH